VELSPTSESSNAAAGNIFI